MANRAIRGGRRDFKPDGRPIPIERAMKQGDAVYAKVRCIEGQMRQGGAAHGKPGHIEEQMRQGRAFKRGK
jgi:hypothetical protein